MPKNGGVCSAEITIQYFLTQKCISKEGVFPNEMFYQPTLAFLKTGSLSHTKPHTMF